MLQGLQGSTFTLLLELFPTARRTMVGVLLEIYWALGLAGLAGLSYALPHWRDLQLAVSAPTIATLLFLPWVPESRLWIASRYSTQAGYIILPAPETFNAQHTACRRSRMSCIVPC